MYSLSARVSFLVILLGAGTWSLGDSVWKRSSLSHLPNLEQQNWTVRDFSGGGIPQLGVINKGELLVFSFSANNCLTLPIPAGTVWMQVLPTREGGKVFAFDGKQIQGLSFLKPQQERWVPRFKQELLGGADVYKDGPIWQEFVFEFGDRDLLAAVPDLQGRVHLWHSAGAEQILTLGTPDLICERVTPDWLLPFSPVGYKEVFILGSNWRGEIKKIDSLRNDSPLLFARVGNACVLLRWGATNAMPVVQGRFSTGLEATAEGRTAISGKTLDFYEIRTAFHKSSLAGIAGGELDRGVLSRHIFDFDGRRLAEHINVPIRGSRTMAFADVDGNGVNDLTLINPLMYQYGDKDAFTRFLVDHQVNIQVSTTLESWPPGASLGTVTGEFTLQVRPTTVLHFDAIAQSIASSVCFGDFDGDGMAELAFVSKGNRIVVVKVKGSKYVELGTTETKVKTPQLRSVRTGSGNKSGIVCWNHEDLELIERR